MKVVSIHLIKEYIANQIYNYIKCNRVHKMHQWLIGDWVINMNLIFLILAVIILHSLNKIKEYYSFRILTHHIKGIVNYIMIKVKNYRIMLYL
jgi:hypothetical protein